MLIQKRKQVRTVKVCCGQLKMKKFGSGNGVPSDPQITSTVIKTSHVDVLLNK